MIPDKLAECKEAEESACEGSESDRAIPSFKLEEVILELLRGSDMIVSIPTVSGKSF